MKKSITLIVILISSYSLRAQVINLKASDKSIRYDLIKPAHIFKMVTAYDSTGTKISENIVERVIKVDLVKHQIVYERSKQFPFGYNYTDTSIVAFSGPVSYHETSNPLTYEVKAKFSETSVDAAGLKNGVMNPQKTVLAAGYFDDNILESLIGYIPMEKNIKYHLVAYRFESKNGTNPFDIEYQFDDVLKKSDGSLAVCKVLHFVNGYSSGYFWIDKKTNLNVKEVIYFGGEIHVIMPV